MGRPAVDLTGQRFTRLVVIERVAPDVLHTHTRYRVRCDCGQERIVGPWSLKSGNSRSCGCLRRELASVK